jgi:hypothetical protein
VVVAEENVLNASGDEAPDDIGQRRSGRREADVLGAPVEDKFALGAFAHYHPDW